VIPLHESIGIREYGEAMVGHYWESDAQAAAIAERHVILAEHDGAIVGVTELGSYKGEPIIWKLYIAPDLRGQGIGEKLVEGAIAALPDTASSILVEHAAENERVAKFYDRVGFHVAWIDEGEGPGATTVWRRKQL
jgi:ribosomal protein S18 acetylase RimI-like enzyme